MNRKYITNKVIVGILGGLMMVSIGALPFTQSTVKAASLSSPTIIQELKIDKLAPNKNIKVILDKLVSAGIIASQPQELEALKARQGLTPLEQFEAQLDNLVSAGTINKDMKTNIVNYIKEKQKVLDKVKNMNETERQNYFANKSDLTDELINNMVISQNQVDAIEQAIPTLLVSFEDQCQGSGDMPITQTYNQNFDY